MYKETSPQHSLATGFLRHACQSSDQARGQAGAASALTQVKTRARIHRDCHACQVSATMDSQSGECAETKAEALLDRISEESCDFVSSRPCGRPRQTVTPKAPRGHRDRVDTVLGLAYF